MSFEHKPMEGIAVQEDLAGTTVTLTRRRGSWILPVVLTVVVMVAFEWLLQFDFWTNGYLVFFLAGMALNQSKTEVAVGARGVTVETRLFGRQTSREVVPHEAIMGVELQTSRFRATFLEITRVGGRPVRLKHGTRADLTTLRELIDDHREGREVVDEAEAQGPEALRALRVAEG